MSAVTNIRITANNKDAIRKYQQTGRVQDQTLDSGKKKTDAVGQSVKKLATQIGGAALAYKGMRLVIGEVNRAWEEFLGKEQAMVKLSAAVEIAGESWALLEHDIRGALDAIQETTRFSDDEMAAVLSTLTLLTGDVSAAQEHMKLVADMASSGLFNIATAGRYVGMTLEGNYTMLSRYIPKLKMLSDQLGKNATEADKTAAAMKILQETFGGMAEKEVASVSAQMQQMANDLADMRAGLGEFQTVARLWWQQLGLNAMSNIKQVAELLGIYGDLEQVELPDFPELLDVGEDDLAQLKERYARRSQEADNYRNTLAELEEQLENVERIEFESPIAGTLASFLGITDADTRKFNEISNAIEEVKSSLALTSGEAEILETVIRNLEPPYIIPDHEKIEEVENAYNELMQSRLSDYEKTAQHWDKLIGLAKELGLEEEKLAFQAQKRRELAELTPIETERRMNLVSGLPSQSELDEISKYFDNWLQSQTTLAEIRQWADSQTMTSQEMITKQYETQIEMAEELGDMELANTLRKLMAEELITDEQRQRMEDMMQYTKIATDILYQSMGGAFENIERMFVNMIKRMIAEALVLVALMQFAGVGMAAVPGMNMGKLLGSVLGFKASGGDVTAGNPYIVGEKGHELFIPDSSGSVIPHNETKNTINMQTDNLENLLERVERAIYHTALTETDVSIASERGSLMRQSL